MIDYDNKDCHADICRSSDDDNPCRIGFCPQDCVYDERKDHVMSNDDQCEDEEERYDRLMEMTRTLRDIVLDLHNKSTFYIPDAETHRKALEAFRLHVIERTHEGLMASLMLPAIDLARRAERVQQEDDGK